MVRKVNRRKVLAATVASVGGASLAGCLGGCKGDPTIKKIDENPDEHVGENDLVSVKGKLSDVTRDRAIVDDGTGTAAVTPGPLYEWDPSSMSTGTCVDATGTYAEDLESEYNTDIVLFDGQIREA